MSEPSREAQILELADKLERNDFFSARERIAMADALRRVAKPERGRVIEGCAQIAEAIDSGRGNEREIAIAIRALKGTTA